DAHPHLSAVSLAEHDDADLSAGRRRTDQTLEGPRLDDRSPVDGHHEVALAEPRNLSRRFLHDLGDHDAVSFLDPDLLCHVLQFLLTPVPAPDAEPPPVLTRDRAGGEQYEDQYPNETRDHSPPTPAPPRLRRHRPPPRPPRLRVPLPWSGARRALPPRGPVA